MKKIFTLVAALCCVMGLMAVPVPKNFTLSDAGVLSWEHDPLGADSTFSDTYLWLYTEAGDRVTASGMGYTTTCNLSGKLYAGRQYYVEVWYTAYADAEGSSELKVGEKAEYHFTKAGDPTEILPITNCSMDSKAYVRWTPARNEYLFHRVIVQKKNASDEWDDVESKTTTNGWNSYMQMTPLSDEGTYRAVIEGLQGTNVVTRGMTDELVVKEMVRVTFDAQGLFSNPASQLVETGTKVSFPSASTYTHVSGNFTAWYKDAAGTEIWDFDKDTVSAATTLYACEKNLTITANWTEINSRVYAIFDIDSAYAAQVDNVSLNLYNEMDEKVSTIGLGYSTRWPAQSYLLTGHSYYYILKVIDQYGGETVVDPSPTKSIPGEQVVQKLDVTLSGNSYVSWGGLPFVVKDSVWLDEFEDGAWVNKHEYGATAARWASSYNFNLPMDASKAYRARVKVFQCSVLYAEGVAYAGKAKMAVGDTIVVDMGGYSLYYKVTDATNSTVELVNKTNDAEAPYPAGEYPTGDLVLPETVSNSYGCSYTVTRIAERALSKSLLTKLTIPATVTRLGDYAFANSESLAEVVLAERSVCLASSASYVFTGCPIDTLDITYWTDFTNVTGINPLLNSNIKGYKGKNNWYEAIDGALCYTFYYHHPDKNLEICHLGARTTDLVLPTDMRYVNFKSKAFESVKTDIDIYLMSEVLSYIYFYPLENEHIKHLYVPCGKKAVLGGGDPSSFFDRILTDKSPYTVTLGAVENGSIAIVEVPENDCNEVTIEATPDEGFELESWSVSGETDGNRITLTVNADIEVTATFTSTATGLNKISAKAAAKKQIVNGQLLIIRDGKAYNAQGAVVNL